MHQVVPPPTCASPGGLAPPAVLSARSLTLGVSPLSNIVRVVRSTQRIAPNCGPLMPVPPVQAEFDGEPVSAELPPLLSAVYREAQRYPADLLGLRRALEALLRFLASPAGRTNANCWAADLFFMHNDRWERDWEHLPDAYQDVLGDLGGALHDTVWDPATAENFESTPEHLLARVERLPVSALG